MALAIPIVALAFGLMNDAFAGFPFWRGATSAPRWLGSVLALGSLYVFGEAAIAWISSKDKDSDPLWKTSLYLAAMIAVCGAALWALWLLRGTLR